MRLINYVVPHGNHIYKTSADMYISKICDFTPDKHTLTYCKYVLPFCQTCPSIVTPNKKLYDTNQTMCPKTRFRVYKFVSHCTLHGGIPFEEK